MKLRVCRPVEVKHWGLVNIYWNPLAWMGFFFLFFQPKYFSSKFILRQTFTVIVSLCLAYFLIFFCLFFICISMTLWVNLFFLIFFFLTNTFLSKCHSVFVSMFCLILVCFPLSLPNIFFISGSYQIVFHFTLILIFAVLTLVKMVITVHCTLQTPLLQSKKYLWWPRAL